MKNLIDFIIQHHCSDLLISQNNIIKIRKDGKLFDYPQQDNIATKEQIVEFIYQLSNQQIVITDDIFTKANSFNFAINFNSRYRIRCNLFQHQGGIGLVARVIDNQIQAISTQPNLPHLFFELTNYKSGLIIIAGKIGAGKSTTMASIVEEVNLNQYKHIITLEDPIEFQYYNKKSLIHQLTIQTSDYQDQLLFDQLFRQDPDLIVIGEIRNHNQFKLALKMAEAGHLVITSMHGADTVSIVQRLYHSLPSQEIYLLAQNLKIIIAQQLLFITNKDRTANYEIMINNNAIKNLILEGKIMQIYNIITTSKQQGMFSFKQHQQEFK